MANPTPKQTDSFSREDAEKIGSGECRVAHRPDAVKVIDPRGNEVMRVHRLGAVRYE